VSSVCRAADTVSARVLLLFANDHRVPAAMTISEAARARLVERLGNVHFYSDFLDLQRFPSDEDQERVAHFLTAKYADTRIDAVIAVGPQALRFIARYWAEGVPSRRILYSAVGKDTADEVASQIEIVGGTSAEFDYAKTLELAHGLQPAASQVVAIFGASNFDQAQMARARAQLSEAGPKIAFWGGIPLDDILQQVANLPTDTIVLTGTFYGDPSGRVYVPTEPIRRIVAAASAPTYSVYEGQLGNGLVGGYTASFADEGRVVADLASDVLEGKETGPLPVRRPVPNAFRVDARQLERWGLSRAGLPPATIVLFEPASLWQEHKGLIIGATIAFLAQTTLLAGVIFQSSRRNRAERLLKDSEERMTFTAASVNAGLWQYDSKSGELWATNHCRKLLGLGDDVAPSREAFLAAVHPEDRETADSLFSRGETGLGFATQDIRVVHPDGQLRWIRLRSHTREGKDGRSALSGIFVDITEQKAAETEAALQRREVAHLMRVSVLGELSGAIAHEINQPLTAILSNAHAALEMVPNGLNQFAELRETIEDIIQEDNRAGEVISRLRGLLKKATRTSEAVAINELVQSTIALLNSELISRRVAVRTELASDLPPISGDAIQIQQVLLNLMMNAMDAMGSIPAGNRLMTIRSQAVPKGTIEVNITDCGEGVDEDQGANVFEPFFTTKEHGLGLGLAICSTIIQAHGGTLTLTNSAQGGAVATFSLPVRQALAASQ